MKHGAKYERLRETLIISLLAHPNVAEAASACGLSERCARGWMQRADFAETLRAVRRSIIEQGASRLTALVAEAVETLRSALKSKKAADRVRAARSILEFQQRFDKDRLQERLTALEQQLAELKGSAASRVVINHPSITVTPDTIASLLDRRRDQLARPKPQQVIDVPLLPASTTNGDAHALP